MVLFFTCGEGDAYRLGVNPGKRHTVSYNSSDPTITQVAIQG